MLFPETWEGKKPRDGWMDAAESGLVWAKMDRWDRVAWWCHGVRAMRTMCTGA
jgi:hypothetical protein